MAKKRKVARRRTAKRARPAARRRAKSRSKSKGMTPDETMNMIAALLVVVLIGLGIYFYKTTQKTGALPAPTQVAMVVQ